ncbi:MAG TPA: hypothetical protein VHY84_08440 [Bryobacteraceae bacterium]|jgi:hypothetical protein|nr:hypothetical protein [Bryobacteraceae bacterium]
MTNILNQFVKSLHSRFQPSSPDEYFALCLARLLGEPEAAPHYAVLASQYSQAKLLCAYRRAVSSPPGGARPARIFHDYLSAYGANGSNGVPHPRLMAVRVERRGVATALFSGVHLEGRRVRQLSSDPNKAEASAEAFIREVFSENDCPSAAIEYVSGEIRRSVLHNIVRQQCQANGISLWEVPGKSILNALAHPALKTRGEVREMMLRIWPMAALKQSQVCALDAFAVGLYVQTERLFAADH